MVTEALTNVSTMKANFDSLKHIDENGKEYWDSRELSKAMGYSRHRNFESAIERAKQQMESIGRNPDEHMAQVRHPLTGGNGAVQMVNSYRLDKAAAYNVAMNADPSKTEVAFAQEYFLQSTAKAEVLEQRMDDRRYIENRDSLSMANKQLASTLIDHDVPVNKIGIVLNAGDRGFFDMDTKDVKTLANIKPNKPLADVMGKELTAFKMVAQIMSQKDIENYNLTGVNETSQATFDNNRIMRNIVIDKFKEAPEEIIPKEDIKKVEKRYDKQTTALLEKLYTEEC